MEGNYNLHADLLGHFDLHPLSVTAIPRDGRAAFTDIDASYFHWCRRCIQRKSAYMLMSLALPLSHRWRLLHITASYELVRVAISKLRDLSTPHLTNLHIATAALQRPEIVSHTGLPAIHILTGGAAKLLRFSSEHIPWSH